MVVTAADGEATGVMAEAAEQAETTGVMEADTTPTGQEGTAGTAREVAGAGMGAARASAAAPRADSAVRAGGAEELPEGEDEVRTDKSPTKMLWERISC